MPRRLEEAGRERRIRDEILADAYGGDEQAIGWYCYLQQSLTGPVNARCVRVRSTSPLRVGEQVVITGLASEDDCRHDMVVLVSWQDRRDEEALINFLDRFLLQHRLPDGRTVVERFVRARGDLPAAERDMLLGWRDVVEACSRSRGSTGRCWWG